MMGRNVPRIEELPVSHAYRLTPEPQADDRGWFARYFSSTEFWRGPEFVDQGLGAPEFVDPGLVDPGLVDPGLVDHGPVFVQFNQSFTRRRGTVRGMHLQIGDGLEIKLVKCIRGRVLDVLLDVRQGSPTFLQYAAVELSAENRAAAYLPPGVAHGFQTLADDCELIYHHTNAYMPALERGIRFDDPRAGIAWPLPVVDLSPKDAQWPLLAADFSGYDISR